MLDDEFVSSSRGEFRRFLVQCLGRAQLDCTWITKYEFHDLNHAVLEWYIHDNSSESSSFAVGENDAVSPKQFLVLRIRGSIGFSARLGVIVDIRGVWDQITDNCFLTSLTSVLSFANFAFNSKTISVI